MTNHGPHKFNTAYDNPQDPNFPSVPLRLCWADEKGRFTRWSQVYLPAPGVAQWDGVPSATHAVGSIHGVFCYVRLTTTGRGPVHIPGTDRWSGPKGLRQRVQFVHADGRDDHSCPGFLVPLDRPFGSATGDFAALLPASPEAEKLGLHQPQDAGQRQLVADLTATPR